MRDAGGREQGTLTPALSPMGEGDDFWGNYDDIRRGMGPQRAEFLGIVRGFATDDERRLGLGA